MSTLVIVLCCVFFASSSVAVTVRELLENAKAAATDSMSSMESRVQKHLRPKLVENAKQRIIEIQGETMYFVENVWNETLNSSLQANFDIIHTSRSKNSKTSECDRLHDDLLNSINATLLKAQICTAETVDTINRLIKRIDLLTNYILDDIRSIWSNVNYLVDEDVDVRSTDVTIAMIGADVRRANSTINENLPKLKRKINKLKRLLNDHRVSDCLTNNKEYAIYDSTLSTFYEKSGKCVAEKTFKT